MKSLLSALFSVALVGCASAPPPAPAPPEAPVANVEQVAHDSTISHDNWTVTVPLGWKVNDKPEPSGDLTQVLEATSNREFGRGPVRFALMTTPLPADAPKDEAAALIFGQVVAQLAPTFFPNSRVDKQAFVLIDGRPGSLTALELRHGLGIVVVATAKWPTGYVLTCGGDVMLAQEEVAKACIETIMTFHVK